MIELPRKNRWIVFSLILSLVFVMNMDQGIVSGSTSDLKQDLQLSNKKLGMLGSVLFLGSTIGCIVSFTFINKFDRRKLLLISIGLNSIALISLSLTNIYYIILVCRVISGFMLSFVGIYTSVWCNQFGIWKKRSLMLALSHVSSPFGYIAGYVLGIVLNWKVTFFIQSAILIIHFPIFFWLVDPIYFSITLRSIKEIQNAADDSLVKEDTSNSQFDSIVNSSNSNNNDSDSFFEDLPIEINHSIKSSTWTEFKVCLKSFVFIMSTLALTFIFMIISGVQFWSNDYMETILNISNDYKRLMIFGSISITAPTVGILLSGVITSKIGGYETKHAILIPLIGSLLVSIIANFIVITNNIIVFSLSFWLYLLFGSFCLPPLTGIIMTSVPAQYSANANALSTLFYNVAGKFPAPYLFGMLKQYVPILGEKFPMTCLLNSALFGVICLALAANHRYRLFAVNKDEDDKSSQYDNNSNLSSKDKSAIEHKGKLFNSPSELSSNNEQLKETINGYDSICVTRNSTEN